MWEIKKKNPKKIIPNPSKLAKDKASRPSRQDVFVIPSFIVGSDEVDEG